MTMKKLALSTITAAMLVTSSYAAVVNTGTVPTVSKELLSVQPVTFDVSSSIVFKCEMNKTEVATGNAAGVQVTIPGIASSDGSLSVWSIDTTPGSPTLGQALVKVATFGSLVASADQLVFDGVGGTAITQDVSYVVCSSTTAAGAAPVAPTLGAIQVDMIQNAASASAKIQVVSNDGVSVLDEGTGFIAKSAQQFTMTVATQANELIDAANGFFMFTSAVATDDVAFRFEDLQFTIDHPAKYAQFSSVLTFDQKLKSAFTIATVEAHNGNNQVATAVLNDFNVTYTSVTATAPATTADVDSTYTTTFSKINTNADAMDTTNFKLSGSVVFTGRTTPYVIATDLDAGAWNIFGYNAQIPNIRNNTTNLTTYINITNSSSISADAIFTILPETDGINAGESICSSNEGSIPANASRKFNVADILANSNCSQAVKDGVNMAIELTVPTSPDSVYANAYTKNTDLPDFIVLPVYNSSTMSY